MPLMVLQEQEQQKREEQRRERMASRSIVGTNFALEELVGVNFNQPVKKERKITTVFKNVIKGLEG